MNIKQGLEKEYAHYVEINDDPYSKAVIRAGEKVMVLLDEGKTPEEAEQGLHGEDLTGYMAGAAISAVVHFHTRGEEMKKWWNREQGGTGEEKGTINPAIIEIGGDNKN